MEASKQTVIDAVARWDDGVSGKLLIMRLVAGGYESRQAQRVVQVCLDQGLVHIGAGLRIRLGSAWPTTLTPPPCGLAPASSEGDRE